MTTLACRKVVRNAKSDSQSLYVQWKNVVNACAAGNLALDDDYFDSESEERLTN